MAFTGRFKPKNFTKAFKSKAPGTGGANYLARALRPGGFADGGIVGSPSEDQMGQDTYMGQADFSVPLQAPQDSAPVAAGPNRIRPRGYGKAKRGFSKDRIPGGVR